MFTSVISQKWRSLGCVISWTIRDYSLWSLLLLKFQQQKGEKQEMRNIPNLSIIFKNINGFLHNLVLFL